MTQKWDFFYFLFFWKLIYNFFRKALKWKFLRGITKPCTLLHRAPCTSTQLISTSTQLDPPPISSFQPPPSSLQHPQQYLNQNIVRNWAISPNLGRKNKSWRFWLKIGTYGISEVLIPNPDLDFQPQNPFFGKFGPKISKLFVLSENWRTQDLKDADFESRLRFLKFWSQNPFLGKFGPKNSKLFVFSENSYTWYLKDVDSYCNISFRDFKS